MVACAGDQTAVVTREGLLHTFGCIWNHDEESLIDTIYEPLEVSLGEKQVRRDLMQEVSWKGREE